MKKLLLLSALLIFACSSDLFAQQLDYEELLVEHLINKLSRENPYDATTLSLEMIKINDTEQNTVSYVMSGGSKMIKRTSNYIRLYEREEDGETMLQYSYRLDNIITIKGDLNNDNIDEVILQIYANGGGNVDWGETFIVEDNLLTNFTFYDNYGNNIIGNGYGSYFKINKIENQKLYADYGVMKGDKWDWDRKKIVGELINGKMTQIDFYKTPITDSNIREAVSEWISNPTSAYSKYRNISDWDVSNVTDMSQLFYQTSFNQDISSWDVSSVTDMQSMFQENTSFNQPIGNWDVSSVTDMGLMFFYAQSFNQDISSWDVSSVTTMLSMFYYAISFNQPIGNWDVSSVTNMKTMFCVAASFNQDLSYWNVNKVTNYNEINFLSDNWTLPKPNF